MAVVQCDFQKNILSVHKSREQKIYVLWLNVYGSLWGIHTDDQTTNCQTHRSRDVRRENGPGSKLEQTQLPSNLKKEEPANRLSQPLVPPAAEFWAAAFPFKRTPQSPLARRAAHNSLSSKCLRFIFGKDHCRVCPCTHKPINRQIQSPQAKLKFALQMYFCYKLWWTVVPHK